MGEILWRLAFLERMVAHALAFRWWMMRVYLRHEDPRWRKPAADLLKRRDAGRR